MPAVPQHAAPGAPGGRRWVDRAACAGAEPALFFAADPVHAVARFCAGCPVLEHCAAHGLALDADSCRAAGVLGAMTAAQRRAARRDRRDPAAAAALALQHARARLVVRLGHCLRGRLARLSGRVRAEHRTREAQRILATAAAAAGVTPARLRSRSRDIDLVVARLWAFRQLRDLGLTLVAIGELLGRDHSTVVHGLRVAEGARRDQVTAFHLRTEDAAVRSLPRAG